MSRVRLRTGAIVVTTLMGFIVIIRTFRSQLIVQQAQMELLQIERDRFLGDKKPCFELLQLEFSGEQVDTEKPNFIVELKQTGQMEAINLKASAA